MESRLLAGAALGALVSLSACGGGGGEGVASTPAPPPTSAPAPTPSPSPAPAPTPPPTMANDDLLGTLESEDFTNIAASAAVASSPSGNTLAAQSIDATIIYDKANKTYTLTTPTGTISFAPGDIDQSQSTADSLVYLKTAGDTTDSLTLTRPGRSGPLTFRYVGGAFWQQTTIAQNSGNGSIDAIVYGVETPDADVPRGGVANYDIALIGAISGGRDVSPLAGEGTASVDFDTGQIAVIGTIALWNNGIFSGSARLSSQGNTFSGTLTLDDDFLRQGTLEGMLFGPNAEEFGASWSFGPSSGTVAVGALLGREGAIDTGNVSFDDSPSQLANSQTFSTSESVLSFGFDGVFGQNWEAGDFSSIATTHGPMLLRYDAATNTYTLISPDVTSFYDVNFGRFVGVGRFATSWDQKGVSRFTTPPLSYVRTREWEYVSDGDSTTNYRLSYHTYGMPTADDNIIRGGTAGYKIVVNGVAADNEFRNPMRFSGIGDFFVDLATGEINAYTPLDIEEEAILSGMFGVSTVGDWRFNGTLSSNANQFDGTVVMNGIGTYNGTGSGQFFGPAAQEVGGVFRLTEADGNAAVGSFVGVNDDSVTNPNADDPGILDLTEKTELELLYVDTRDSHGDLIRITYDPDAGGYDLTFRLAGLTTAKERTAAINSGNLDASRSSDAVAYYTGEVTDRFDGDLLPYTATATRLGGQNPDIQLSYTSIMDIIVENQPGGYSFRDYHVAATGLRSRIVPRSGNGRYSAITRGFASVSTKDDTSKNYEVYRIGGKATFLVDFSALSVMANIGNMRGVRISASNSGGQQARIFDGFSVNAAITGTNFATGFNGAMGPYQGSLSGAFFGPDAAEIGGVFEANSGLPNFDPLVIDIDAAFAGVKN